MIEEDEDQGATWLAVGDLMTSLLSVFVLMFIVVLLTFQQLLDDAAKRRIIVIQALKAQLAAEGIQADVNPDTGDVSLAESIYFGKDSASLATAGQEMLTRFIPVYASVIMGDPVINDEVVRVIIEGHTSSAGTWEHNMKLSADRASAVATFASQLPHYDHREEFLARLVTSGRGEIEATPGQDRTEERRVVFRFQFRGVDLEETLGPSVRQEVRDAATQPR